MEAQCDIVADCTLEIMVVTFENFKFPTHKLIFYEFQIAELDEK